MRVFLVKFEVVELWRAYGTEDMIVAVLAVVIDDDVVREVFKANAVPVDV